MDPERAIELCRRRAITCRALDGAHLDGLFRQNEDNIYYRFLYYLAQELRPAVMVELGVCEGRATAHLAAGHPGGTVLAVDPERHGQLRSNVLDRYNNVVFHHCRSDDEGMLGGIPDQSVGLLFSDSVHNLPHVLSELRIWLPKMEPNAPLLFDDLDYFWSMGYLLDVLPLERKGRLEGLHEHGFGYALADPILRLDFERTGAEELTVTWWRGDGERQSRTTPG